ncbi:MAG: MerR family transcriptional regulator [Colwellia sp.]|nr:MerR family transcriptional regulator [Colwellia sp.]
MKQKIGAVARLIGISPKTIRYYESEGLVSASQRTESSWASKGQRLFNDSDIDRLRFVKEARSLAFSIDEIRELLKHYESGPPCGCGSRNLLGKFIENKQKEVERSITELTVLKKQLAELGTRTEKLSNKGPDELLGETTPPVSDAILSRIKSKKE